MAGRYALIAAPDDDADATALAGVLGDPERGGYAVEHARDDEAVARFLVRRAPDDVVLVHARRVAPPALAACPSRSVLVLATDRGADLPAAPGRAVIAGASTRALVRALHDGRADGNADGEVSVRELHNHLARTHRLRFADELGAPFVVTRTQYAVRRRRRLKPFTAAYHERTARAAAAVGAFGLLVSLPLPWLYGEPGLSYAFASGTAWPSRLAPILCLAAALAAALRAVRLVGGVWVALLGSAALGAVHGLEERFAEPDVGMGITIAYLGLVSLAIAIYLTVRDYAPTIGLACVGVAVVTDQLVGPRSWYWLAIGAVSIVLGAWSAYKRPGATQPSLGRRRA